MYVREKKIKRGIGTWDSPLRVYSYWQVVQGTRVDGKVRQTVVAHIGAAEDRKQADAFARMKGILCGVRGCGKAATEELEYQGFRPKHTLELLGSIREYPFLVCLDHLDAWRRRERFRVFAALLRGS